MAGAAPAHRRRMAHAPLPPHLAVAAALLALPATASAADTLVVPDPAAEQVTALDGTLVWVSGEFGRQRLMQRTPDGTIAAVRGTREARDYSRRRPRPRQRRHAAADVPALRRGRRRARRCGTTSTGAARRFASSPCRVAGSTRRPRSGAPASPTASSARGSAANRKRSGLYVKRGSRKPVRLPRPKDAVKFRITNIADVDLRSTRVAAVAADVYEYSFSQTTAGTGHVVGASSPRRRARATRTFAASRSGAPTCTGR